MSHSQPGMNSLISVIIPVYNIESDLQDFHRCIQSVLSQTYVHFELLLINDGSTDRTAEICEEYACNDHRIRLLCKQNGGVSTARNLGLDHAAGEWVMFIDDDDWIEKECLETCMKAASPDVDLVVFSYKWKAEERLPDTEFHTRKEIARILPHYSCTMAFISVWGKLYKKENIDSSSLRFDVALRNGEDSHFFLRYLLCCHHMLFLSGVFYHYDIHPTSLTNTIYADWDRHHLFLSKKLMAIDEVEKAYNVPLGSARSLHTEAHINNYLSAIVDFPLSGIRHHIRKMVKDPCLDNLYRNDDQRRKRAKRWLLLDWFIRHKSSVLFTLYIKFVHARIPALRNSAW